MSGKKAGKTDSNNKAPSSDKKAPPSKPTTYDEWKKGWNKIKINPAEYQAWVRGLDVTKTPVNNSGTKEETVQMRSETVDHGSDKDARNREQGQEQDKAPTLYRQHCTRCGKATAHFDTMLGDNDFD